jgi:predicted  nucleic acid-binding Zn-ribbon protein
MNQHLDTIVQLQRSLIELGSAEERLHGIPDWMRDLHDEHSGRKAEIAVLEETAEAAAHDRRAAEGALSDEQEKLKKFQQQINRVSTQREYGALLAEIDTAKATINSFEEQACSAMERLEQAQRDLAEKREGFRELDGRYATELARWESEKPAVQQQVDALRQRVADLRERLPKPLIRQFERILERNPGRALAPVRLIDRAGRGQREWHCGLCNYRVRPQVVVEIRNSDSLVQCDSCKRILYLEADAS